MRGGGGVHLTNFRVLTRCSHCFPVRLGPLPISIWSVRPCELGKSRARPAAAYGAPCVGSPPHSGGASGSARTQQAAKKQRLTRRRLAGWWGNTPALERSRGAVADGEGGREQRWSRHGEGGHA